MRILFLNQYFPPDPAPTGVLFSEIADALRTRGHEVSFIDAGQEYRTGQGKGGRMRRELLALVRMLRRGLAAERPDVVVSGTSPPCLIVAAHLIAMRHGARSVHWCMDLYPEIAVALGEVREGLIVRLIDRMIGWAYRRTSKVVALDADMAGRLRRHGIESVLIRPWVMASLQSNANPEPRPAWTWLYSGNLGRAHEWETLLAAQALLESRAIDISLVFQGGGPSWPLAKERGLALGLRRVEWRPYVAEQELRASLLEARCLVVTERPEVQGMLWPSKLALMLALPRPLVFVGPIEGAIADLLKPLPHAAVFAPGDAEQVAEKLEDIRAQTVRVDSEFVVDADAHRSRSLREWVDLIESV